MGGSSSIGSSVVALLVLDSHLCTFCHVNLFIPLFIYQFIDRLRGPMICIRRCMPYRAGNHPGKLLSLTLPQPFVFFWKYKSSLRSHFQKQLNHHHIIQNGGGVAAMSKIRPMDLKLSTYVCYDIES